MRKAIQYTKQLEDAGFSRAQAETQVSVFDEILEADLATKTDIQRLETLVAATNADVRRLEGQIRKLDETMRAEIHRIEKRFELVDIQFKDMRNYIDSRLDQFKHEMIVKQGAITITALGTLAAFQKFFS